LLEVAQVFKPAKKITGRAEALRYIAELKVLRFFTSPG
jgi:hypothetical protein